jgi:hypothetical protein
LTVSVFFQGPDNRQLNALAMEPAGLAIISGSAASIVSAATVGAVLIAEIPIGLRLWHTAATGTGIFVSVPVSPYALTTMIRAAAIKSGLLLGGLGLFTLAARSRAMANAP